MQFGNPLNGSVAVAATQFSAANGALAGFGTSVQVALNSFTYPIGTTAANYHSCLVVLTSTGGLPSGGEITVKLIDDMGNVVWCSAISGNAINTTFGNGSVSALVPLLFGNLNANCKIEIDNNLTGGTTNGCNWEILLDQTNSVTAVLLAGITDSFAVPVYTQNNILPPVYLSVAPGGRPGNAMDVQEVGGKSQAVVGCAAGATTLVAAPGAGLNLRIRRIAVLAPGNMGTGFISFAGSNGYVLDGMDAGRSGSKTWVGLDQGVMLAANNSLTASYTQGTGPASINVSVAYDTTQTPTVP